MSAVQATPTIISNGSENRMKKSSNDVSNNSKGSTPIKLSRYYKSGYTDSEMSDTEISVSRQHSGLARNHFKSMGNIYESSYNEFSRNLTRLQNSVSNLDLSLHSNGEIKKFETLQVPIVGYEVMEERARFTIYKLKVEDDKRDQSWLVFRRYTDFVRLYSRIKAEQPNLVLPLPGKRMWFRDNFESAFLEERVRGLQIFVNAVLTKLPNHPVVREFFCLDEPPQVLSYQPEVQAVYGALEDSITTLKMHLKQKDATIMHLHKKLSELESKMRDCPNCSTNGN